MAGWKLWLNTRVSIVKTYLKKIIKIISILEDIIMLKIEVRHFFYDLIHCKDKILAAFEKWDKQYEEDPRGALVAGIQDSEHEELISLLITIQRLASGFQEIQEMINEAEQKQVDDDLEDDEDDEDD